MSPLAVGAGLAVAASVALNASYLMQHAGTQGAPPVSARRPLVTLRALLTSRWWLAGLVAGLTGWALHVAALSQAPLSIVQAVAAGGLALTVPAAAWAFGERLGRTERFALTAMIAGLVLLGVGAVAPPVTAVPSVGMLVFLVVAGLAAGALALTREGPARARALGAAGGVLYGAGDAATKAVTINFHGGVVAVLTSPWTLAVLLASAGAFLAFQRGLQIGPSVPVVALMTAATNAVAVLGGLLVFGDVLGRTPALAVLHVAAFLLIGAAGLRLAAVQARLAAPARPVAR
jgi:hypothetical protein